MNKIYYIIFTIFLVFTIYLLNIGDNIIVSEAKWSVYINFVYFYITIIVFLIILWKIIYSLYKKYYLKEKQICNKGNIIKKIWFFILFLISIYSTFFIGSFINTVFHLQNDLINSEIQKEIKRIK